MAGMAHHARQPSQSRMSLTNMMNPASGDHDYLPPPSLSPPRLPPLSQVLPPEPAHPMPLPSQPVPTYSESLPYDDFFPQNAFFDDDFYPMPISFEHYIPDPQPDPHSHRPPQSAASDSSIEIVSHESKSKSRPPAKKAVSTAASKRGKKRKAGEGSDSEASLPIVRHAYVDLITPEHEVTSKKGKKVVVKKVKAVTQRSQVFTITHGMPPDELCALLQQQTTISDLDLAKVSWHFDRARSLHPLGSTAGIDFLWKEVASCDKLVIFTYTRPSPKPSKKNGKEKTSKKTHKTDTSASDSESAFSSSDSNSSSDGLSKLTNSKKIKRTSAKILARYPKGRCKKHRDIHCFEDPVTGYHFDLGHTTRLMVYTNAIIKGEVSLGETPDALYFGKAHALPSGRGHGSKEKKKADDTKACRAKSDSASSSPSRAPSPPRAPAPQPASSPIPTLARHMPLAEYAQLGAFEPTVTAKLEAIGHTPATKVRHIRRKTWTAAGITAAEFIETSERDAAARKRVRLAARDESESSGNDDDNE